jgi:hypothetical protein
MTYDICYKSPAFFIEKNIEKNYEPNVSLDTSSSGRHST